LPSSALLRLVFRVFFLTIRPPLRSTLFPYTTLFRSLPQRAHRRRLRQLSGHPLRAGERAPGHRFFLRPDKGKRRHEKAPRRLPGDRKSTRLNSSHVSISYAVFCLKKKKREQ